MAPIVPPRMTSPVALTVRLWFVVAALLIFPLMLMAPLPADKVRGSPPLFALTTTLPV